MSLRLGVNEPYRAAIELAARRTAIPASTIAALIDAEAALLPNGMWDAQSHNASYGATGLTQFVPGTWRVHARNPRHLLHTVARERGLIGADAVPVPDGVDVFYALRTDPLLSIVSAAEYAAQSLAALRRVWLPARWADDDQAAKLIYLAHHEGVLGALGYLSGLRRYTRPELELQIDAEKAAGWIARSGGSCNRAYRNWLAAYVDEKIVPARFRDAPESRAAAE